MSNQAEYNEKIPWREFYQIAQRFLHIPPSEFWQLTMPEWKMLLAPYSKDKNTLTRNDLKQLMQQFPD